MKELLHRDRRFRAPLRGNAPAAGQNAAQPAFVPARHPPVVCDTYKRGAALAPASAVLTNAAASTSGADEATSSSRQSTPGRWHRAGRCRLSSTNGRFTMATFPGSSFRSHSASTVATATAAAAASSSSSAGSSTVSSDELVSPKREAQLTLEQYKEIYDRLIGIFQTRPRDDWKKLIVFSKQWDQHSQGVLDRIKELADREADVDKKMGLRKLFRALQNVNDEVSRYNRVLLKLADAADDEWDAIVAAYRGDLQKPFFEHMQCLMVAAKEDPSRLDQLVLINTRLVALIANHDAVAADQDKLDAAAAVYRDLLSSVSSMEDLDRRMAELSSAGKIDPAFLQISAKAYGAARDTNMTKDEAKWVAYKLYRTARDYFDRQQPAEKRIIEYLINVTDPTERRNMLDQAVTPGPVRATETHDYLYSTPQRLFLVLDNTLRAYFAMRDGAAKNLNTPEAAVLPRKVRVMMELRDDLIRRYL
ncbi:hypothetical protein VOLCADRAFT_109605 [Volvox carteri f. nagariensis]|uniref:Uncharacterized protein n=1 Tax=Volvox carteri f. nagariensis TaxID=3068 RepID=D8TL83_VOLCA|nr:uncharacterized protein VOLCADRAFT_109605 [Volvox carteri f. nagariensis]EFJ51826.1 hypothetical protein VOLCADRAFT_109605 [Volvox carteri f. nagariensis]|eukprot:XP_002947236.1 hypothetical protein VOLCADRAFT_109605 [Volvox carteri f. nagariensis]